MRDTWLVFDANENEIARLHEDSGAKVMARRLPGDYSSLLPQSCSLQALDGGTIATYRTHFNLLVYRLGISIHTEHEELDDLVVLAAGCLIAAIKGRQ